MAFVWMLEHSHGPDCPAPLVCGSTHIGSTAGVAGGGGGDMLGGGGGGRKV